MLNPTSLLADALGRNLAETYRRIGNYPVDVGSHYR
jgi:hypothetical protein